MTLSNLEEFTLSVIETTATVKIHFDPDTGNRIAYTTITEDDLEWLLKTECYPDHVGLSSTLASGQAITIPSGIQIYRYKESIYIRMCIGEACKISWRDRQQEADLREHFAQVVVGIKQRSMTMRIQ